jgi:membrane-associated protease RseP (regulator of RpoE activity)
METPAIPPSLDVPLWERGVYPEGSHHAFVREPPPPLTWRSVRLNVLLFLATVVTVFLAGSLREFRDPTGAIAIGLDASDGLRMLTGVLSILLCHEMGHYIACRYYGVAATLPFLIPGPPLFPLVGTFGALIRIKGPIPHRRALFDIGIAGPLAGFVACLPILILGVVNAQVRPTPQEQIGPMFGEPLLFQWVATWLKGPIPENMTLFIDTWGHAAWFGLLVTALNLIPVGQLDGGHVTYALFGRRAHMISRIAFAGCLGLLYFSPNWLIWSALLWFLRRPHPPTLNDAALLGPGRAIVGALGLAILVLSFTPSPMGGSWHELLRALGVIR